tara:strand:+ start:1367 stop:2050 length:684 start_codon:yes stop_codon:yes gene_type:complete
MLQKQKTTSLFYNKYLYKLRLRNPIGAIFRGMNLSYAKQKLDEMQRQAESELPIKSPFRVWRGEKENISLETFMDNCIIFTALESNKEKASVRCEGQKLDIYSNESSWLLKIAEKIGALEFHEPATDSIADFLSNNAINTVVTDKENDWPYKAFLAKQVDRRFSDFCKQNSKHIKIGSKALEAVEKHQWTQGFYFRCKTEKYLMLAKIAAGTGITKVIKYVSEDELA